MPTGQQYATNVPQTTLTGLINATATVLSVNSSSGWPSSFPFTAVLDIGTSTQEPVDVTNITGTTWTVTRAIDGTTGFTHSVGGTVTHADIGRDFRESRAHIDATGGNDSTGHAVHGLTGTVVGTSDTQTLSNKTFSGNIAMGSGSWTGTGSLTEAALGVSGLTGAATATRFAGANAGGPPTSGTFVTGDIVADTTFDLLWLCTAGGSPGTWTPMASSVLAYSTTFGGSTSIATITLPVSITPYFSHVRIVMAGNSTNPGVDEFMQMQYNGDAGGNYQWEYSGWNSNGSASTGQGNSATSLVAGAVGGNNTRGHTVIDIPFFQATSTGQPFRTHTFASAVGESLAASTTNISIFGGGSWNSTAAITSISLFSGSSSSFTTHTSVSAYLSK